MRKITGLLSVCAMMLIGQLYAQDNAQSTSIDYFAQSLFVASTPEEVSELETNLLENPHVKQVRISFDEQRVFILTKDLSSLTEAEYKSWFGEYAETVDCIQIGKLGEDTINTFPFVNCH